MATVMGCGCLIVIILICVLIAKSIELIKFGISELINFCIGTFGLINFDTLGLIIADTVGFIVIILVLLPVLSNFLDAKNTRNKIKENISKTDKIKAVFDILKKPEKNKFHDFIILHLKEISDTNKINIICQECLKTRNALLVKLILEKNWIASQPAEVKVYTILKTNQLKLIENSNREEVKYLIDSLKDQDLEIVNQAKKSLEEIRIINEHGIDYLCQQWAKERDKFLESLIVKHKYQAVSPLRLKILTALKTEQLHSLSELNLEETLIAIDTFDDIDPIIANNAQKIGYFLQDSMSKSLIYFLTEQWQKYEQIDFDQNVLKDIFLQGDSQLRKKITEKIKISGRSDGLQVIFAQGKQKNLELMTDYDWQVTVELLSKTNNNQEKWRLAQLAPPFYSQQLLKQIQSCNFINAEKSYRQNLLNLGQKITPNLSYSIFWSKNNSETVALTDHSLSINSLVMNQEGTLLASGSGDKTIKLWELPSGKLLHTLTGHSGSINNLVMNQEENILASGSGDKTIKLWELTSGKLLHTLTGHTYGIRSLVMNRKGTLLVSGSYKTIKLWELPSGNLLHTLTGHTNWIRNLVINREGNILASGGGDKTIKLWELPSGKLLHTLTGHTDWIRNLVMNRKGTVLASSSSYDRTIKLWELPSGKLLKNIGHTDWVYSLAINRKGNILASASGDQTIKLWELPSGILINTIISPTYSSINLIMNREDTLLAFGSDDKTIKLSKLYSLNLDRLPLSKIISYYDDIQDCLKRDDLGESQRNCFEFILALINNYRSFEIDVEDAPIINEAGEFDIEIEG